MLLHLPNERLLSTVAAQEDLHGRDIASAVASNACPFRWGGVDVSLALGRAGTSVVEASHEASENACYQSFVTTSRERAPVVLSPAGIPGNMASGAFAFEDFQLDVASKRLSRAGTPIPLTIRHFDLLRTFVSRPGEVLSKDMLIQAAWQDVAVTDNSLTQAILQLRRTLDADNIERYIETARARGYRFVPRVTRVTAPQSDADFEELFAPHRAFLDGTAALETLERSAIARARTNFQRLVVTEPDEAACHVGLAVACVLQFEMTRTDAAPDTDSLRLALTHAREAIRLNPDHAEACATFGFVLQRTGNRDGALAALRRAVKLEPDNWRHHLRLSFASWGEERLRAARHALALFPGAPFAYFLIATVFIARGALVEADREVSAGMMSMTGDANGAARFMAVGLYWLKGLLSFARGVEDEALEMWERELALETSGHLYARECSSHAWYAIGAFRYWRNDGAGARAAFEAALARVHAHAMANSGVLLLEASPHQTAGTIDEGTSVDSALARAVLLMIGGDTAGAARMVAAALTVEPPGSAGWVVPIEPLLRVSRDPVPWAGALAGVSGRAW